MDDNSQKQRGGKTPDTVRDTVHGAVHDTLAEVAQKLNLTARSRLGLGHSTPLPPLLLLSDEARFPDPAPALKKLPAGSGFIFRHYDDPHRKQTAMRLRDLAGSRGLFFLVAGDVELAVALEADGCHMPERLIADLARCRGTFAFNTAAAHSAAALAAAAQHGASAALLSPIFPTKSHPGAPGLGAASADTLAVAAALPVYALGGVNLRTAPALSGGAFAGLAGIEGLAPPDNLGI